MEKAPCEPVVTESFSIGRQNRCLIIVRLLEFSHFLFFNVLKHIQVSKEHSHFGQKFDLGKNEITP